MHHLAAFQGSIPLNSVYAQVPAIQDGGLTRNQSGQFIMPSNMMILGAHVQGTTTVRGQIQAPSLRQIAYPEIYPLIEAAPTAPPTLGAWQGYGAGGPRVLANEALGVNCSEGGVLASPTAAALWIAQQLDQAPPGMQITLVADVTLTNVAFGWSLGTLAFETVLAAGTYTVTGMGISGAGALYARLLFPGQVNFRPGVMVDAAVGNKQWRDQFRLGRFGTFGQFVFNAPPQIEVFGNVAGAQTYAVFLDVIKS
jgi:hypothetical protein